MDSTERLASPPTNFSSEAALSEALMKLSFKDRTEIEEEFHGVRCGAVDETPELVQEALADFDASINDAKEKHPETPIFCTIQRITPPCDSEMADAESGRCYLNDPNVRLRFLRAECFVVDKAVHRFRLFLELMTEIFGMYILERPVRRSDFSKAENKELKRSRAQFLPFRDRSGRRVAVTLECGNLHLEERLMCKIFMYLYWLGSSDIETQRKGVVSQIYVFDDEFNLKDIYPKITEEKKDLLKRYVRCIPVRMVATNLYYKDTIFFRLMAQYYIFHECPERRPTIRIHFGEQTENLYTMASLGIPVDVVPITSSGSLKFTNHCAWLDAMERIEKRVLLRTTEGSGTSPSREPEIVDCPFVSDVVFRVGATSKYNPGNTYYRELMQSYLKALALGENKKKKSDQIAKLVYDIIVKDCNGRFLEWWGKGKTWIVLRDPDSVRKKIAKAFIDMKLQNPKRGYPGQTLDKTLENASDIVDTANDTKGSNYVSDLQEYYSVAHPSKRLRRGSSCSFFCGGNDANNSCFGRNFFPVQ